MGEGKRVVGWGLRELGRRGEKKVAVWLGWERKGKKCMRVRVREKKRVQNYVGERR